MNEKQELILIPKYEKYMEYMLQVILKMPRTEKFNIGNEFKLVMYKMLENILYISNLPYNTNETDIKLFFKKYGNEVTLMSLNQKHFKTLI